MEGKGECRVRVGKMAGVSGGAVRGPSYPAKLSAGWLAGWVGGWVGGRVAGWVAGDEGHVRLWMRMWMLILVLMRLVDECIVSLLRARAMDHLRGRGREQICGNGGWDVHGP
jgi:hypothetical protein